MNRRRVDLIRKSRSPGLSAEEERELERLHAAVDRRFSAVDERLAVLVPMRAQLDGLPLINRAVTTIQQDVRALRAAFNDLL